MASKKARKNKNSEPKAKASKPMSSSSKKWINRTLILIVVGALLYFAITASMKPAFLPSADGRPSYGPDDATVEVIQFGCFTCPFSRNFNLNEFTTLREEYGDRVRFVYRNSPIAANQGSVAAAEASLCAEDQDAFWEYSQILFSRNAYDTNSLVNYAGELELDTDEFRTCVETRKYQEQVREDTSVARKARVGITPTIFANGVRVSGAQDINLVYRRLINDLLEAN